MQTSGSTTQFISFTTKKYFIKKIIVFHLWTITRIMSSTCYCYELRHFTAQTGYRTWKKRLSKIMDFFHTKHECTCNKYIYICHGELNQLQLQAKRQCIGLVHFFSNLLYM